MQQLREALDGLSIGAREAWFEGHVSTGLAGRQALREWSWYASRCRPVGVLAKGTRANVHSGEPLGGGARC